MLGCHRPIPGSSTLYIGRSRPAPQLPDLGLSGVNLGDTSYITTKIHPIFGVPGSRDPDDAIGQFYVSFTNSVCIYDLPHGAIAMQFAGSPVLPDIGFNTDEPAALRERIEECGAANAQRAQSKNNYFVLFILCVPCALCG